MKSGFSRSYDISNQKDDNNITPSANIAPEKVKVANEASASMRTPLRPGRGTFTPGQLAHSQVSVKILMLNSAAGSSAGAASKIASDTEGLESGQKQKTLVKKMCVCVCGASLC